MKKILSGSFLNFTSVLLVTLSLTTSARASDWSGSGGDGWSGLTRMLCLQLVKSIHQMPYESIPGEKYEVSWDLFEAACITADIRPAFSDGSESEWMDLKDEMGVRRTALFVTEVKEGKKITFIAIHGPRLIEELSTNPVIAYLNLTHEFFKEIGIDDSNNQFSAPVFADYGEGFFSELVAKTPTLTKAYEYNKKQLDRVNEYDSLNIEIATKIADEEVDRKFAIFERLKAMLSEMIAELKPEIDAERDLGVTLAREIDGLLEEQAAHVRATRDEVRKDMNEFANVLGKQISKMGMIPFGKQNLGRIAKAAGRIQAASYGLQPLQKKSTEIEWKLAQAKRLTFSLEIKIKEFEGYREKRKQLVHDFVDSFQL